MQQIPIYEVWLESWTLQDIVGFGTVAAIAIAVLITWARNRSRPSDTADLGLGS